MSTIVVCYVTFQVTKFAFVKWRHLLYYDLNQTYFYFRFVKLLVCILNNINDNVLLPYIVQDFRFQARVSYILLFDEVDVESY